MTLPAGHEDATLCRRIAPGAELVEGGDGTLVFASNVSRVTVRWTEAAVGSALRQMASVWLSVEALVNQQGESQRDKIREALVAVVRELDAAGLVGHAVVAGGRTLAEAVPCSSYYAFSPRVFEPGARFQLSRFAVLHREGAALTLESPLGHAKVLLGDSQGARLAVELRSPTTLSELEAATSLPPATLAGCLTLLDNAACLASEAEDAPPFAFWEFHDLLFHARSRAGRHARPMGGTYRFGDGVAPTPAQRPPRGVRTPLARPDTARLSNADVPFTRVQEERRSLRAFGEEPLSLEQLAEFLFRTARVKEERRNGQLVARRPYPAAGGLYELEIYALVDRCRGLDPGAYHYDPREHALTRLSGDSGAHGRLLDDARDAAGTSPQVLLVLAARFATVFWKYESIGYSLILKDVGVLQHAMSLVATAMGLGACILGAGDSDAFCEAVGTDYYEESSVGELVLGSRPEAGPG